MQMAVVSVTVKDSNHLVTNVNKPDASAQAVTHVTKDNVFIANTDMTFMTDAVMLAARRIARIGRLTFLCVKRKVSVTTLASVTVTWDTHQVMVLMTMNVESVAWAVHLVRSLTMVHLIAGNVMKATFLMTVCHIYVSSFKIKTAFLSDIP